MNEWWQSLAARERLLVSIMSVMVVITLLYMLLLDPLFSGARDYSQRVEVAEQDLAWMKQVAPRLNRSPVSSRPVSTDGSVISIVDATTKQLNLTTKSTQSLGQNKVRVQFNDSSFEDLVSWFGTLHDNHNLLVETANVRRNENMPGAATATITVQKAGL